MTISATFCSANSFSVANDKASEFPSGVRVLVDCGADGLRLGTSAGYADATVTLAMDAGQSLTGNLAGVWHGNDIPDSLCNHAGQHGALGRDPLLPAAIGALGLDVAAEVSVTAAGILSPAALGKMHVVNLSADGALGLPAVSGNAGKLLGIRIARACTKLVILGGNGSETIDGALTQTMWAGEVAVLLCDGTGWTKIAGRSIPMLAMLQASAIQTIPSGAYTDLTFNVASINIGSMANPVASSITPRRAGVYRVFASMVMEQSIAYQHNVYGPGLSAIVGTPAVSGYSPEIATICQLQAGAAYKYRTYQSTGSSQKTYASILPCFCIEEVNPW